MSQSDTVVLFVVDGLRPDGLRQADTPHLIAEVVQGGMGVGEEGSARGGGA